MNSRERFLRALEFNCPDRVPVTFPPPFPSDIITANFRVDDKQEWIEGEIIKWYDEWGNIWARFPSTSRGEPKVGALEDWTKLESWQPPNLADHSLYEHIPAIFDANSDKFKIGELPGFPFAIMRYLRRMDNFLADVLLEPDKVLTLSEKVMIILEEIIYRWSELGADAVFFCEDWGTQERLLVHPDIWVSMFKPMFTRLVSYAHGRKLKVMMHSCGWIWEIIPHLIECGIDVLQLDQPTLMGLERLATEFGGRIAFWSPVDIQSTLQTHDEEAVRIGARELIGKLGSFNGGFIAGYYADNMALGLDPSFQKTACKEFLEYGSRIYA